MSVPKFVTKQFGGSARSFKSAKRKELKQLERALNQLRYGCAYVPNGPKRVDGIRSHVDALKQEMSVREWGR